MVSSENLDLCYLGHVFGEPEAAGPKLCYVLLLEMNSTLVRDIWWE